MEGANTGHVLRSHTHALALLPSDRLPPLTGREQILTAALHWLGLLAVARLAHWPFPLLFLAVVFLCLPSLIRRRFHLALLTPLGILYALTAIRALVAVMAHYAGYTTGSFYVPEPFARWLPFGWTAALVVVWCLAIQVVWLMPAGLRWRLPAAALGIVAMSLAAWLYFSLVPAGVTGADPYAYVQMALDLADHSTPLHRFPLAGLASELGLPVYPTLHVGYHAPSGGLSPTVWPPGFSVLLAGAYSVFGEAALYHFNAVMGLLGLALLFLFTAGLLRLPDAGWGLPLVAGALAVALLATSFEQTIRLAVPLADVSAQFFSMLSLGLALLATLPSKENRRNGTGQPSSSVPFRQSSSSLAILAGTTFALAYTIRYTQFLLFPAFLYLGLTAPRKLRFLLPFFGTALLFALPDLAYRELAFGSPLAAGSRELSRFALRNVPPVLTRTWRELFSLREFGLWLPFILLGAWQLSRHRGRAAIALALGFGPVFLFHLPYEFLRLRDLLFLWPVLAALAAAGALTLLLWLGRFPAGRVLALLLGFALLAGRWNAIRDLPTGFYTSGMLLPVQRASVGRLTSITPPQAVIAGSLNSGAVELYAGRLTTRPGGVLQPGQAWTEAEWLVFVEALLDHSRPIYLLMDGVEMEAPLEAVKRVYRVEHVADLDLPYYVRGGGSQNLSVPLYRIVP